VLEEGKRVEWGHRRVCILHGVGWWDCTGDRFGIEGK
jgi:hypothetical protein